MSRQLNDTGDHGPGPAPIVATAGEAALPLIRHPQRVVAFVIVIALVLIGAFAAGTLVKSPTDDALEAAKTVVPVVVSVETRVVDDGFTIPARLSAGKTFDVSVAEASTEATASAAGGPPEGGQDSDEAGASGNQSGTDQPGTDRIVVTATAIGIGEVAGFGRLLGEVSGRPLFALPTSVPMYRDLRPAARGNDVVALQRTLIDLGYVGVRRTGELDTGTLDAVRRLYNKAGYSLPFVEPGVQGVAWREFAGLPTAEAMVAAVTPVGTTLTNEVPLVRLQVSPAVLTAQVTAVDKEALQVGGAIGVSVDGGPPMKTTVLGFGQFATDEKSGVSGYPISVAVPQDATLHDAVTIQLTPVEKAAPGPVVPVVALRQDAAGTFVTVVSGRASGDAPHPTPTPVTIHIEVLAQAHGWAAIKPNPKLPVGTRILVEP